MLSMVVSLSYADAGAGATISRYLTTKKYRVILNEKLSL